MLKVSHHLGDKALCFLISLRRVDQHFADVLAQIVADRADDDVGFLIDQEGRLTAFGSLVDRGPQLEQVIQIPLQFFGAAAKSGSTDNHAHFFRQLQRVQGIFQFLTLFAFNAAGDTASTRVVGHQYQIAAGQADKGGQGSALVTTFFLVDLNNDFHAFTDHILDVDPAAGIFAVFLEILAGNLFQRQKAVTFGAEIDKGCFEGGFDAGNLAFIDVGFFLFAGTVFDVQIIKLLAINKGNPNLFGVGCID